MPKMKCYERELMKNGSRKNILGLGKAGIFFFIFFSFCLWEIDGETVETVSGFIFLGSKITADGDCSHEIKRRLLLGRKVMTNLDSIFKSRDIALPTKVR